MPASRKSAKGADARRQAGAERIWSLGGVVDPVPVLREFLKNAGSVPVGVRVQHAFY